MINIDWEKMKAEAMADINNEVDKQDKYKNFKVDVADARDRAIKNGDNYLISDADVRILIEKYSLTADEIEDMLKGIILKAENESD